MLKKEMKKLSLRKKLQKTTLTMKFNLSWKLRKKTRKIPKLWSKTTINAKNVNLYAKMKSVHTFIQKLNIKKKLLISNAGLAQKHLEASKTLLVIWTMSQSVPRITSKLASSAKKVLKIKLKPIWIK